MNKLKNFLKSQKLFMVLVIIVVLPMIQFGNYYVYIKPNINIQICDEEALGILLEAFEEEGAYDETMKFPLNSDASTEELQRYKLYYDIAFDMCIHSYGFSD